MIDFSSLKDFKEVNKTSDNLSIIQNLTSLSLPYEI